jgi:DNA polymerase-3 subunit alpha (Gram-positive type)
MSLCADTIGKLLVAVGNVHFLNPEDEICKKVLLSAKGISADDIELPLYFKTTKEMLEEFSYLGEATAYMAVVLNTQHIANSVDDKINPLSKYACDPSLEGSKEEINDRCKEHVKAIYGNKLPNIVKARLDWELESINKHDFFVHFSIAQKLVERVKSKGYTVGSRGSVAASFVAYLLGITDVNPLAPHYRCNYCKHTEFDIEDVDNGFDLPDKVCPCAAPLWIRTD